MQQRLLAFAGEEHDTPTKGEEVRVGHRGTDPRSLLKNQEPTIALPLSASDLETLRRLQAAGIINLHGLSVVAQPTRLLDWTYKDIEKEWVTKQRLRSKKLDGRDSTVLCRLRYLRFLEEHPVVPVSLRPPSEESWLEHVYYRMEEEDASGTALNHYRKALRSLLIALGVPIWESLKKGFEETEPHWHLPEAKLVPRFWKQLHHPTNSYLNSTYQHIFHFGFHTGVRPPSEICALNLEDVDFDARRVTVTEVKKGGRKRDLDDVEPFVISALNAKSLRNYVKNVRPQRDAGKSKAFFLNDSGDRFHPNDLGQSLSEAGKAIWPQFTPYTMRRYFATQFLVQNDLNVYATALRIGDKVATVERHYLDKATVLASARGKYKLKRLREASSE